MKYVTTVGEEEFTIDINRDGQVTVNEEIIDVDMHQMESISMYSILIEGRSYDIRMEEGEGAYIALLSGETFEVVVADERTRRLAGIKGGPGALSTEAVIKAPMPGVVVEICVNEGDEVEEGDIVVILESMKMQNEFKAPRPGTVHSVRVTTGVKVDQNAVMITIS